MYTDQIINLISGLATLSASLIALFTLLEIKRQRKQSYKPEPVIKSSLIYVYSEKFKEYYFPFKISRELYKNENSIVNLSFSDFYLELVNVGISSAKNLSIKWDFDFNKAISTIESKNEDRLFLINYNTKSLEIKFPLDNYREVNVVKNQFEIINFDYLVNSTSNSFDVIPLRVPVAVMRLYLVYISLALEFYNINEKSSKNGSLDNFPELSLNIRYEDISGNKYSKFFNVEFDFVSFMNPMDIKFKHETGTILVNIKEKK